MATYADIKGAKELVKKYHDELSIIEKSISELQERKEKLQSSLDDSNERFTIESIEKNAKTKRDLNLISQYLKEANEQKDKLVNEIEKKSYNEAKAVLSEHREAVHFKHNDLNKTIVERLYEIRYLFKELKRLEAVEHAKVQAFVTDLSPYMEDEDTFRRKNGGAGQHYKLVDHATKGSKKFFHRVPEKAYLVQGMTEPDPKLRDNTLRVKPDQLNELYNVDKEQAEKQAGTLINK